MEVLIPLAILFGFFWFFVLLPQRRRQRTHMAMQDAIAPGDEVITAGGLHGLVETVDESIVSIEIAPGTVVRVDRRAIAARVEPEDRLAVAEDGEPAGTGTATDGNPG